MTKKPKQDVGKKVKLLDLDPDAWPKFEQMIRKVSKAGPQHRDASSPPAPTRKPTGAKS